MQALTKNPDPETASRPFDAERDGFVLSEGSCVLILEEAERAAARGARVYAEVAGYGASADAFHITAPDPKGSGAALAIERALADAGAESPDVQIRQRARNLHPVERRLGDASAEGGAGRGGRARPVPVSSTKSMTGHMLGAAGAVEPRSSRSRWGAA